MARRRYLVMYDICEEGRLRRVHGVVKSAGTRFQYSVFLCDLSETELIQLKWEVGELIDHTVDSLAIVDLGSTDQVRRGTFQFLGLRPMMPTNDSTVL